MLSEFKKVSLQMRKKKIPSIKQICTCFYIVTLVVSILQCTPSSDKKNLSQNGKSENTTDSNSEIATFTRAISYNIMSVKDTINWLKSLPDGDTLQALLVVNRIDKIHLLRLDSIVFPDTIGKSINLYSPFPKKVDGLANINKILFISYYAQAFAVYEKGLLIRWGPANLGKKSTPTPTGLLSTNWKAKNTISTINPTWVMDWYFNLENFHGASMHEYALPGYPASHACVRLFKEDAKWMYYWADQWILDKGKILVYGTPVIIFDSYPLDGRKPWLQLPANKTAMEITPTKLMFFAQEYLPTVILRQNARDSIQNLVVSSEL